MDSAFVSDMLTGVKHAPSGGPPHEQRCDGRDYDPVLTERFSFAFLQVQEEAFGGDWSSTPLFFRTEAVLEGLEIVLREHKCPAPLVDSFKLQVHDFMDNLPDELVWIKEMKYLLAYPLSDFLKNDRPEPPPSGGIALRGPFARWIKPRLRVYNRANTHLWFSWLQCKRAALPVSDLFIEETYQKHHHILTQVKDPLPKDCLQEIKDSPGVRALLDTVGRRVKAQFKRQGKFWEQSASSGASWERFRGEGGQHAHVTLLNEEVVRSELRNFAMLVDTERSVKEQDLPADFGLRVEEDAVPLSQLSQDAFFPRGKGRAQEIEDASWSEAVLALGRGLADDVKKTVAVTTLRSRRNRRLFESCTTLRSMEWFPYLVDERGNEQTNVHVCHYLPDDHDSYEQFFSGDCDLRYNKVDPGGGVGNMCLAPELTKVDRDLESGRTGATLDTREVIERSGKTYPWIEGFADHGPMPAMIQGILEPLKVRVISKGPSFEYYSMKRVQKALHRGIASMPEFRLIARTFSTTDVMDLIPNARPDEEIEDLRRTWEWNSVDYSAATDGLSTSLSEYILDTVLDPIRGLGDEGDEVANMALNINSTHRLFYPPPKNGVRRKWRDGDSMTNGQLMGNPISFPVLCLANLCLFIHTVEKLGLTDRYWSPDYEEDRAPTKGAWERTGATWEQRVIQPEGRKKRRGHWKVLVNGDDMVYVGLPGTWEKHIELGELFGLKMSVGKAYRHPAYLNINSTSVDYDLHRWPRSQPFSVPFLQVGLMLGNHKVLKRVGTTRDQNVEEQRTGEKTTTVSTFNTILQGCRDEESKCRVMAFLLSRFKDRIQLECQAESISLETGKSRSFTRNLFLPTSTGGMGVIKPRGFKTKLTTAQRRVAGGLRDSYGPYVTTQMPLPGYPISAAVVLDSPLLKQAKSSDRPETFIRGRQVQRNVARLPLLPWSPRPTVVHKDNRLSGDGALVKDLIDANDLGLSSLELRRFSSRDHRVLDMTVTGLDRGVLPFAPTPEGTYNAGVTRSFLNRIGEKIMGVHQDADALLRLLYLIERKRDDPEMLLSDVDDLSVIFAGLSILRPVGGEGPPLALPSYGFSERQVHKIFSEYFPDLKDLDDEEWRDSFMEKFAYVDPSELESWISEYSVIDL